MYNTLTDSTRPTATTIFASRMAVRCISRWFIDLRPKEFRKMRHRTAYSGTTQSPQRGFLRWQQIYLLLRETSNDYCISKKRVTQAESSTPRPQSSADQT